MGNKPCNMKDEFVAQGIHYHAKRWKLYDKDIKEALAASEARKKDRHNSHSSNNIIMKCGKTQVTLNGSTLNGGRPKSLELNGHHNGVPGTGNGVPGCGNGVPGCDNGVPGCGNGVPGCGNGVPGCDNGVPGCGNGVPGCGNGVPGCGNGVPGCGNGVPGCGNGVPGCGNGVPGCGGEQQKMLGVKETQTADRDRALDPFWYRSADHIENIVMSGGGGKGYSFIGSLKALEDCGVLSRLRRVAGSSVGGICAGLLAIGCNPQEIADIFSVDNRWLFQDQSCTAIYCVPNIMKKFGIHPADRFYRIYGGHIARKTGNPDITFKELYELTGRELCIVVTNLNRMCAEYCHPKTTPDMPIRLAVRMTMSFPVLYQPVQCEVNGVTSWYTDGGVLDQYPIHAFDGGMLDMNHNASTPTEGEDQFNSKTLGLYVVGETALDYQIWRSLFGYEIPFHPSYVPNTKLTRSKLKHELDIKDSSQKLSPLQKQSAMVASLESVFEWPGCPRQVSIDKFGDYLGATIEALLVQQRKLLVKPRDVYRTVPVNAGYVGTNDYVLETGDREFMLRQGYECVRRFLIEYSEDAAIPTTKTNGQATTDGIPNGVVRHFAKNQDCYHRAVSMETQV